MRDTDLVAYVKRKGNRHLGVHPVTLVSLGGAPLRASESERNATISLAKPQKQPALPLVPKSAPNTVTG